jgi:hypothetical protein
MVITMIMEVAMIMLEMISAKLIPHVLALVFVAAADSDLPAIWILYLAVMATRCLES